MKIKATITMACSVLALMTATAQVPAPKPPAKPASAAAPKFKAIWEPVPFNKDLNLNAVACVGPETCWAVGDKSTILFTADGGTKWEVQLGGDPEDASNDHLSKVFFLDAKHGWRMTRSGKKSSAQRMEAPGLSCPRSVVRQTACGSWSPQKRLRIRRIPPRATQRRTNDGAGVGSRRGAAVSTPASEGCRGKNCHAVVCGTLSFADLGVRGGRAALGMAKLRRGRLARTTDAGQNVGRCR